MMLPTKRRILKIALVAIIAVLSSVVPSATAFVPPSTSSSRQSRLEQGRHHHHHPLRSRSSSTTTATSLHIWNWNGEDIEGQNRFKACVPYLLPLLDGDGFGKYIYERIPPLGFLDSLFIGPLYENFTQIPFLGLIIFIGLTLGTRGNTEMDRNVRFSAQQAALIDVALVFPELIGSAFEGEDIPRYVTEPCMNFVWYTYMTCVLYSIVCNLRGKKPNQIPYISGYA